MNRWFLFLLSLVFLSPSSLWAWGSLGHKTVAYIAEHRLTPQAKKAVRALLREKDGQNLVSAATWADKMAHSFRPETAPWHYIQVNVRQDQSQYSLEDACKDHNCVVDQIEIDEQILKDPNAKPSAKREALLFLVHFVGDIHQPLHCADDKDRGGNEKWFRYFQASNWMSKYTWVNLHELWDNLLEVHPKEKPKELAKQLEQDITPEQATKWEKGGPKDWAFESYKIAKDAIYADLPEGPIEKSKKFGKDLPDVYYKDDMRQVVNRRLEAAGVRLAWVLNGIFDGQ